jgi:ankyrin repeat protein
MPEPLPDNPNLEWLRKEAKRYLAELRKSEPGARLAAAQLEIARRYGFSSWRVLKAHIDSLTIDGQLIAAAREGDVKILAALLQKYPEKMHVRVPPYDGSLLHVAAQHGHFAVVDLLLYRGFDPNLREGGDNTYAMHWAAAHGHLDIVRRLADAGGDVVGRGDDHQLEVIGWAASSQNRAVADFLVSRGARHHIFSAIAFNDPDEVRRVVERDPAAVNQRMSRNENHQTALQFAVRMKRREMVELLLELGADPLASDGSGFPVAVYATDTETDRGVMQRVRDSIAALALHDWAAVGEIPASALHLMSKRGDVEAVKWLLAHGANPSAIWNHWDSDLTPLHLAILADHPDIARVLLESGADPTIKDSKHDGDAMGWAEFFKRVEIVKLLREHGADRSQ